MSPDVAHRRPGPSRGSCTAWRHALPALLAVVMLLACASPPPERAAAGGVVFVVVRHAEKADASADPELSAAGHARARKLATRLAGEPLVAIYTTDLHRTRQTVAPVAAAQRLQPVLYDPREPAASFIARLRAAHPGGTVLVAGHSNTVPDLVATLCACDVEPMPEHEFDRISTVRIDAHGRARLEVARY